MGVGRGGQALLDFEIFSKNVVFLVSSGKNQISPLLAPPLEKSPSAPLEKIFPTPIVEGKLLIAANISRSIFMRDLELIMPRVAARLLSGSLYCPPTTIHPEAKKQRWSILFILFISADVTGGGSPMMRLASAWSFLQVLCLIFFSLAKLWFEACALWKGERASWPLDICVESRNHLTGFFACVVVRAPIVQQLVFLCNGCVIRFVFADFN